jgi:hypothetical protein
MVKNVLQKPGFTTALVVVGWLSFVIGNLIEFPLVSIPLKTIARVLP